MPVDFKPSQPTISFTPSDEQSKETVDNSMLNSVLIDKSYSNYRDKVSKLGGQEFFTEDDFVESGEWTNWIPGFENAPKSFKQQLSDSWDRAGITGVKSLIGWTRWLAEDAAKISPFAQGFKISPVGLATQFFFGKQIKEVKDNLLNWTDEMSFAADQYLYEHPEIRSEIEKSLVGKGDSGFLATVKVMKERPWVISEGTMESVPLVLESIAATELAGPSAWNQHVARIIAMAAPRFGEIYDTARNEGTKPEDATLQALFTSIGEAAIEDWTFSRKLGLFRGKGLSRSLARMGWEGIKALARGSAEEGSQQFNQNLWQWYFTDRSQDLFEGVGQSTALGGPIELAMAGVFAGTGKIAQKIGITGSTNDQLARLKQLEEIVLGQQGKPTEILPVDIFTGEVTSEIENFVIKKKPKLSNQQKQEVKKVFNGTRKKIQEGGFVPREITREQLAPYIQEGMTTEQAVEVIQQLQEAQKAAQIVSEEEGFIPDLSPEEEKKLKLKARIPEAYKKVAALAKNLGPVPKNLQSRKAYLKDLSIEAKKARRIIAKQTKADLKSKEANLLNPWSSVRYALANYEVASGVPLRSMYGNIIAKTNKARLGAYNSITGMFARIGTTPLRFNLTYQANKNIANWLFDSDETTRAEAWSKLNEREQSLAKELQGLFQGEGAFKARKIRFMLWDRFGIKPPNAPKEALEEGRAMQATGQLDNWLKTQTWGTREYYYMSQTQGDTVVDDIINRLAPPSLRGKAPSLFVTATPSEIQTRKGKGKAKLGSVINNALSHLSRLNAALEVMDDMESFWRGFNEANPSRDDVKLMKNFTDRALGRPSERAPATQIAQSLTRFFWRFHFLNPTKGLWFAYRNLHQNLAYGLTQISSVELAKSVKDIIAEKALGRSNNERINDFINEWQTKISQKNRMYHQALLLEEAESVGELGGGLLRSGRKYAIYAADMLGSLAVLSDEGNRMLAWPVLHRTAQRNVEQFRSGQISFNKLWNRLKLSTLHVSQRMELRGLLESGNYREFVSKVAEYKTENIHFRYETALRAGVEQNPLSRALIGLAVYPRGVFELAYQNGTKPMVEGMTTGNWRQAYDGAKSISLLFAMSALTGKIIKETVGKSAYGLVSTLFHYSPLNPGVGKIKDLFDNINDIQYQSNTEGWSLQQTANAILSVGGSNLEFLIPAADIYIDIYESTNDARGVSLWKLVKKKAEPAYMRRFGKKFTKADRSNYEAIMHVLTGGFEKGSE